MVLNFILSLYLVKIALIYRSALNQTATSGKAPPGVLTILHPCPFHSCRPVSQAPLIFSDTSVAACWPRRPLARQPLAAARHFCLAHADYECIMLPMLGADYCCLAAAPWTIMVIICRLDRYGCALNQSDRLRLGHNFQST